MVRRTKEEAAVTRESLMQAALAVFSRKGYTATTLEDIAHEVGVTRGAIYWHFGSKAELYTALVAEYSGRGPAIVQAAAAEGGSFAQILKRVFINLLTAIEADPALSALMELSQRAERNPELVAIQKQQAEGGHALLAGIAATMGMGIQTGELRPDLDPMEMARAFIAFQNGIVALWLQDRQAFSLKASAAAQAEVLLRGLLKG
jgi:TetR/AcrR family acrAB operon transcriptional repressor